MIQLLRDLWARITAFLFPQDYFAWQTLMYLGLFSFVMSWVARLAGATSLTENLIATAGWIFFAIGVGWFFEANQIRPLGISLAPWVTGAIGCTYIFGLLPGTGWAIALMSWPLVSVAIAAVPHFLTWELTPKLPTPQERQSMILLLLIALLLSSWLQFYFRLQSWFDEYPSLLADNFDNSGFVYRMADRPVQALGGTVLATVESEVEAALEGTPWPYVERWLLNLNDQVVRLQNKGLEVLAGSREQSLWRLEGHMRSLEEGYALNLMAIWSGPSSDPYGYYLEKTCLIQPQPRSLSPPAAAEGGNSPLPMAEVTCDLATPRRSWTPDAAAAASSSQESRR